MKSINSVMSDVYIRVHGVANLVVNRSGVLDVSDGINDAFERITARLDSFAYVSGKMIYLALDQRLSGVDFDTAASELAPLAVSEDSVLLNSWKLPNLHLPRVIDFKIFQRSSVKVADSAGCVPIIALSTEDTVTLPLELDVMFPVSCAESIGKAAAKIPGKVRSQLEKLKKAIEDWFSVGILTADKWFVPEIFHFRFNVPAGSGHGSLVSIGDLVKFTSAIYPKLVSEDDLQVSREALHEHYRLPTDRPFFRKANRLRITDVEDYFFLTNPHELVKMPKVTDKTLVGMVCGRYRYCHYLQDNFDDKGWGCAYRSLQTLISWFRYQGYTERDIPSHKLVQRILVGIGDKPSNIVNSKQWIGSTEVSYVLDSYLKVTSKIINVSSGGDLASKGRQLVAHFETQGTPIMIGGGVLAHTILGATFDPVTGDTKFLVLDPHYTGEEDLTVIVDKGWCGWKEANFWDPNTFYNLCLPQRPKTL